jgi:hypothetical protein
VHQPLRNLLQLPVDGGVETVKKLGMTPVEVLDYSLMK